MNLESYFKQHKRKGLIALAEKIGYDPGYLWSCATRNRKTGLLRRQPGMKLCIALIQFDSRFTMADLRPDFSDALRSKRTRASSAAASAAA